MNQNNTSKTNFKVNIHLIFGILFLVVLGIILYKYFTWGNKISREEFFDIDDSITAVQEPLDYFFPPSTENTDDQETQILFLGNENLAAYKNTDTSICNLVAQKTGATVYDCSIKDSYMTVVRPDFSQDIPIDAFSFYWITTLLTLDNTVPTDYAKNVLNLSSDTLESLETMRNIDMESIDVIALFYDASDYYAGRKVYNSENKTDITYYAGALSAGIELLQSTYPHIRIIVLSPTYAFGVDEDGNYKSSDILFYDSRLSDYSNISAQTAYYYQVSFVDNLYGSVHEDNAKEYLLDHHMLNEKGRELVAQRFIEALTYYDKK